MRLARARRESAPSSDLLHARGSSKSALRSHGASQRLTGSAPRLPHSFGPRRRGAPQIDTDGRAAFVRRRARRAKRPDDDRHRVARLVAPWRPRVSRTPPTAAFPAPLELRPPTHSAPAPLHGPSPTFSPPLLYSPLSARGRGGAEHGGRTRRDRAQVVAALVDHDAARRPRARITHHAGRRRAAGARLPCPRRAHARGAEPPRDARAEAPRACPAARCWSSRTLRRAPAGTRPGLRAPRYG